MKQSSGLHGEMGCESISRYRVMQIRSFFHGISALAAMTGDRDVDMGRRGEKKESGNKGKRADTHNVCRFPPM